MMIDTGALRKHIEEHPDSWLSVAELAQAIGGDERSTRNEMSNLQLVTYGQGDWSRMALDSKPMVIEAPDTPSLWHYSASMTAEDWSRVQASCIRRALGSEQASETRYWLGRAMDSLQALTKLYQEG